ADAARIGQSPQSICPYLLVPSASWRSARPIREHRCTAVDPFDAPALEIQAGLCLEAIHTRCARYTAATASRRAEWDGTAESLAAFDARVARRVPRVVPVALDRPNAMAGRLATLGGTRRLARLALAALMVAAAGLLLAARFVGGA
ncbi:MAG TPA: hypothetical protein VIF84_09880, partial [Candidatus Limnocylindrales bacterium]